MVSWPVTVDLSVGLRDDVAADLTIMIGWLPAKLPGFMTHCLFTNRCELFTPKAVTATEFLAAASS